MNRILRRWLALPLLLAVVLSACDSGTTTPTPTVVSGNPSSSTNIANQPTSASSTPLSSTPTNSTPLPAPSAVGGTPAIGTPRPTFAPPTPAPAHAPSSLDKIEAAVTAGTLDADSGLVYELYAFYEPDKLPAAYRGDDSSLLPEATSLFTRLRARIGQMPAAAQAEVQPFFLRPDDTQSFWYQSAMRQQSGVIRLQGLAAPPTPNFKFADSVHVRVWYDSNDASIKQKAIALAADIDRSDMWGKEKKTMLGHEPCSDASLRDNGGDGRLDLYLVIGTTQVSRLNSQGTPTTDSVNGDNGLDVPLGPANGCPNATFMLVNAALDSKHNRSTSAHELFHAFQFSFNWPLAKYRDYGWWVESSATWAKDLVYPTDDFEQGYLYANWSNRSAEDGPLDLFKFDDNPQYATYLWAFYLRQAAGGDETVIGKLWQASESDIPLNVMAKIENFSHHFKEFAMWNWNEQPVEEYKDAGRLINTLGQDAVVGALSRPNHPDFTTNVDLPKVSARYYKITVLDYGPTDPSTFVNQVRFDFSGLKGSSERGIQAIVTLGSNPAEPKGYLIEDWSNLSEKVICREVSPISSVVLVVTNGAIDNSHLKGPIKAEALSQCPKEANFSYNIDGSYKLDKSDNYAQQKGSASTHESLSSSWDVAFLDREATGGPDKDLVRYVFTATDTYQMQLSGSFQAKSQYSTVNTQLSGGGTYVTHNPPRPEDDEYRYGPQYQQSNGAQELEAWRGSIQTYKQDGAYHYEISFAPPPVAVEFNYSKHILNICPPNSSATYDEKYDPLHIVMTEQGEKDCITGASNSSVTLDKPHLFGPPQWERSDPNYHSWMQGPYDPTTGIIEGNESYTYSACQQTDELDPLNYFPTQVSVMSILTGVSDDTEGGNNPGGACSISYQVHFHVELPPIGK